MIQLLNILDSGALFWALTGIFILGEIGFIHQMVSHTRKEGKQWYRSPFKWYVIALLNAYIWALLAIASDYR